MLSLTEKFERDIQQNHSTVYPLIIIDDTYYISTIEEVIISNNEPLKFKDYGLKISNIKESIDVKSHSFKISNVTLTLSNYEKDGLRKAAQNVGDALLDELTITGSVDICKEKINEMIKNTKLKTIILGFDMPRDKYTDDFFTKLDKLMKDLQ